MILRRARVLCEGSLRWLCSVKYRKIKRSELSFEIWKLKAEIPNLSSLIGESFGLNPATIIFNHIVIFNLFNVQKSINVVLKDV